MLRSLHLAFALLCAALGSQLPAFHDQYLQRVGGALDEVNQQIEARLQDVSWYMLAVEMVFHLEPDIALNTAKNFGPAVPLSISGLAHAFFGFFFGCLIPSAIRSLFPRKEIARG